MSSAIEVLKDWKSKMANKVNIAFTPEEYNALSVALLSLEQKEKLVEWLEKEIKTIDDDLKQYGGSKSQEIQRFVLKEVLDRVGEQK